jgi:hypothetical protein
MTTTKIKSVPRTSARGLLSPVSPVGIDVGKPATECDPAEVRRQYANREITLEEYVLKGGDNLYEKGSWFTALGSSPSSYKNAELRTMFDDFAKTVITAKEIDEQIEQYAKEVETYDAEIADILTVQLPARIKSIKVESDREKAKATIMRNSNVIRLSAQHDLLVRKRRTAVKGMTQLQRHWTKLRNQAVEFEARMTLDIPIKTTVDLVSANAQKLMKSTSKDAAFQKKQEQTEVLHATLERLTDARDTAIMDAEDEFETNDDFARAIAAALSGPATQTKRSVVAPMPVETADFV